MENNMLSGNLKKLRIERGVKQKDFAEALNVSCSAVSKWENGQNEPDTGTLLNIAGYYGITLEELLKGKQQDASGQQADDASSTDSGEKTKEKRKWSALVAALVCEALVFALAAGLIVWFRSLQPSYEIVAERFGEDAQGGETYEISVFCSRELSSKLYDEISDDVLHWWLRSDFYSEDIKTLKFLINDDRKMAKKFRDDDRTVIGYLFPDAYFD